MKEIFPPQQPEKENSEKKKVFSILTGSVVQ
jgi:hypothetical protein